MTFAIYVKLGESDIILLHISLSCLIHLRKQYNDLVSLEKQNHTFE